MIEELNTLKQEIKNKVDQTTSTKALNEIRVEYLGKKGPIQSLSSKMGSLSIEEKKEFGRSLNTLKTEVNELLESKKQELEKKLKVFSEFSMAVDRMIAGEYVDTEYEGKEITEEYLDYIHKNKTGALLKLSVRMGAILAGVNEEDLNKLTNYADKIGLAFQIKDDILGEIGNEKVLGKPVGKDKEMKKCTFVSKYGLKGAEEILEKITNEAIEELKEYGKKAEFLKELALYIKNRSK